jgi:hypothetical protein
VLLQAIMDCHFASTVEDHSLEELTIGSLSSLNSLDVQLALSTAALHDHMLSCGLICFDDDLRYWVKPKNTTWFSDFMISLYDDLC